MVSRLDRELLAEHDLLADLNVYRLGVNGSLLFITFKLAETLATHIERGDAVLGWLTAFCHD